MPLSLTELFYLQTNEPTSEHASVCEPKKEGRNDSKIGSPKRKKKKRKRKSPEINSPTVLKKELDCDDDDGDDFSRQIVDQKKRLKVELIFQTIKQEGATEEQKEENFHVDEDDENPPNMTNDQFYVHFSDTAKAHYVDDKLYHRKEDGHLQRNSQFERYRAIQCALFSSRKQGSLTVNNERRLAAECNENEGFNSKSLSGRYLPRKKIVTSKRIAGKIETSHRLETPEEIQDRVQRMEGYNYRSEIQNRWKNREYNFQCEQDCGNAFLSRAEHYLGSKLRTEKKQRRIKALAERKKIKKEQRREEKAKEAAMLDMLEEDDELNEQSQLLARLSQNNVCPKDDNPGSIYSRNQSIKSPQALSYWDLGYTMPRKGDISYDFDPPIPEMVQNSSIMSQNDLNEFGSVDGNESKTSFRALMTQQSSQSSTRFFFAPNRTVLSNANSTFRPGFRSGHIRHLLTMAAHSLCCGGCNFINDVGLKDRYLRLLCACEQISCEKYDTGITICSKFLASSYLTKFSEDQGQNLLLFLRNKWDNPMEVGLKLGILNSLQDSPIYGNLLTTIGSHSKKNRSDIKRLHKISSANRVCNSTDSHAEIVDDIMKDGSIIISDATASVGIVSDAATMKSDPTDSNATVRTQNSREELVDFTTCYSHIAGTVPPIPQFPLDPTSCLFGPIDRYSKFYHAGVKMDYSIYTLILSTLIARIGNMKKISNKEQLYLKTQKQITDLIEEFPDINQNKLYLRYTNYVQDLWDSDIPFVHFYRGVTGYCNFVANCPHDFYQNSLLDDTKQESSEDSELSISGVNYAAQKILEFCRDKISQNSLVRFPQLRIIYGIALICNNLPSSAANILSRSIDDNDSCSPLDLFKNTLEDLESTSMLSDAQNHDDNCILALELEFILHDASELFKEAVKLDPVNVDYQLWHIGCLASCLLVSSGNSISAGVHAYPSHKKNKFVSYDGPAHEVRHCMKKYNDVRLELSVAIRTLLTLAEYQDSVKVHFAVFSLLEWGQVIGLLVGSRVENFAKDIKMLHYYHYDAWFQQEPNSSILEKFLPKENNSFDISFYAKRLENNPIKIENWRNLVMCLGSISVSRRRYCCWGKGRSWWKENLIFLPLPKNKHAKKKYDRCIINTVLPRLKVVTTTLSDTIIDSSVTHADKEELSILESYKWLPSQDAILAQSANEVYVSKRFRSKCHANILPKAANRKYFDLSIPPNESPSILELSCIIQEVQAYKIFINCILCGQQNSSVRDHIYYNLFLNCCSCSRANGITIIDDCDELRVLLWLTSMGIDIKGIMQDDG